MSLDMGSFIGLSSAGYAGYLAHQIYRGDTSLQTKINCLGYIGISVASVLDYQSAGNIAFSLLMGYNCFSDAVNMIHPFAVQALNRIHQQV